MKNLRWLFLLGIVTVYSFFNSAEAGGIVGGPSTKDTTDSGCTSVDTGTAGCFGANGGTAGGMTSCTAYKFCVTCARPVGTTKWICVEVYRNAECKCGESAGTVSCAGSGACTYKGAPDGF